MFRLFASYILHGQYILVPHPHVEKPRGIDRVHRHRKENGS